MTLSEAKIARQWLSNLQRELVSWGKTDGTGWLFIFKTTIAALLALGVSLRLELGQPVTAMVTVYIIMHPQTGMVLTKCFYRVCGTLAGMMASLAILGLFAQERVPFLLALSLWIGLCTTGAAVYRNFKSYGFTLAGYTAAMISLPLAMQPTGYFDFAVNRVSEVVIGILCAAVVSDVIFPQSLSTTIIRTIQNRYAELIGYVRTMISGKLDPQEIEKVHLRLIGNIVGLESYRCSVAMEASDIRAQDLCLRRLNHDFMAATTTLHSLHQLVGRLQKAHAPAIQTLILLRESLAEALSTANMPAYTAEEVRQTVQRLEAFRETLPGRLVAVRQQIGDNREKQVTLDVETTLELLDRFILELEEYMNTYAAFLGNPLSMKKMDRSRFATRTDMNLAILTGIRAMFAMLLVATIWIATAWPYGASAVMMAGIVSALFAPASDPALALKVAIMGNIIAFIAAFACKFFVLTHMDGFSLLCAGMFPFILVGPFFALNPKLSMIGLGYSTMFCFMISPANAMLYDPVQYINFGSALMLGVAAATVTFALFVPVTGRWFKRRTSRLLRRQVGLACAGPLPGLTDRFESGTRDIPQRLAGKQSILDPHDREILDWMFIVLEVGRAVIELRQEVESMPLPQSLSDSAGHTIKTIDRLFAQPTAQLLAAALEHAESCLELTTMELEREDLDDKLPETLRRMMTTLHQLRTALCDEDTVLTVTLAGSQAGIQGEPSHVS